MTKTYLEKLQDPRWQRKRLEIMQRADFACEWCGDDTSTLHIHHGHYSKGYEPWDYENETLYCLCKDCHSRAEKLRQSLYAQIARLHPRNHEKLLSSISGLSQHSEAPSKKQRERPDVGKTQVIVVGAENGEITRDGKGVQEFQSIQEARNVFPDIDPDKNTSRFTWAMKEMREGKILRLRFETWAAYELYSD